MDSTSESKIPGPRLMPEKRGNSARSRICKYPRSMTSSSCALTWRLLLSKQNCVRTNPNYHKQSFVVYDLPLSQSGFQFLSRATTLDKDYYPGNFRGTRTRHSVHRRAKTARMGGIHGCALLDCFKFPSLLLAGLATMMDLAQEYLNFWL